MKLALRIVAALLVGIGTIWTLQGVNVLPGSFMTGHIQWAYRGGACIVAGIAILVSFGRSKKNNSGWLD